MAADNGLGTPGLNVLGGTTLGKRQDYLHKREEKKGTASEIVNVLDEINDNLSDIKDNMKDGDTSSLFGNGDEGDSSGLGDLFSDMAEEKIGGAITDKLANNSQFSKMFGNISSMSGATSASSQGVADIAKGAGGSGGMIALQIINKVLEAVRGILSSINDAVETGITRSIENQKQYLGPISARLQSFSNDSVAAYKDLSENIRNIFTNSKYVDQQQLLANLNDLVRTGIGYNLEDRAYLQTIRDRTVATFDLLEPSLNRLIRLQQSDLSRAQMGSEAYLTQYLNEYFKDSSYLTDMYDSVVSQLLETTSQMSYQDTTGFLFNTQKWLSALYSVGISSNAINTIAEGINYLGSGNVSALTGNNQLNTLFAMSAQKAGLDYANLLTYGLSSDTVDKLLNSMVKYLQDIANNTDNEVLKSEYGRVFGNLTVSDLRAIQNLTTDDMLAIHEKNLDYVQAFEEVDKQAGKLNDRTPLASRIETMFNNFLYSLGSSVAEDEESYTSWYLSSIAEELTDSIGGVLPGIIGELFSNGTGVVWEGIKTAQVVKALGNLDMFQEWVMEAVEAENTRTTTTSNSSDSTEDFNLLTDAILPLFSPSAAAAVKLTTHSVSVQKGVENWEEWANKGMINPFYDTSASDLWVNGTARMGQYSSSYSLAKNAFEDNEAKIKEQSQNITSIDDIVAKSVDDMYTGFFGPNPKSINVNITGDSRTNNAVNSFGGGFNNIEPSIGAGMIEQSNAMHAMA